MNRPRTIYDLLQLLADYHDQRRFDYERQSVEVTDPMKVSLLEHLTSLEDHAAKAIRVELAELDPEEATYLPIGSSLPSNFGHGKDCRCGDAPTFEDTLACVLASDELRSEVLNRLESGSAAPSVVGLAKRLRELEEIQGRQISNFTRQE